MRALFLNADASKPNCALYDAGITYAEAFRLCKNLDVTCEDIGSETGLPDPTKYDLVIFNYQHVTCQFIPLEYFQACKKAAAFLYEARLDPAQSPTHVPGIPFSILISPDPTLETRSGVWSAPRVIPRHEFNPKALPLGGPPIISTYGFPSPWKDFDAVIRHLNDDFDEAIFRVNFPLNSHQVGTGLPEMMRKLAMEIPVRLKNGITFQYSENLMSRPELIDWLTASDLNVFLAKAERGAITGGALLASTDLAIAARAPLMVSDTVEARHLSQFKYGRMREAICEQNVDDVRELYNRWSPEAFAEVIDRHVEQYL